MTLCLVKPFARTGHKLTIYPATVPYTIVQKESKQVTKLNNKWQTFIKELNGNDPKTWDWICQDDTCPSIGMDSDGKLRLINLVFSGNLVYVLGKEKVKGIEWSRISTIPLNSNIPDPTKINNFETPWLVHRITYTDKYLNFSWVGKRPWDYVFIPLISDVGYVRSDKLLEPTEYLPKIVKYRVNANIRKEPTTDSILLGTIPVGSSVLIGSIYAGNGGVWGKSEKGWSALNYKGAYYTDWIV